ncbi:hypothetical protein J4403_03770 [Candidatus Woesearchaeota archaeon]|nr:hypothetical protein [uncultured archaeon]MBS3167297.1 hypothetical protein [Candidatus Woesearchaeota archaeon]
MKSKKGAIELSMNTIIIVIIGIAMLGLGLFFVNKVRLSLTGAIDKSTSQMDSALNDAFESGETAFIRPMSIETGINSRKTFGIGFVNEGKDCELEYNIKSIGTTDKNIAFVGGKGTAKVLSGAKFTKNNIQLNVQKGTQVGDYEFELDLSGDCDLDGINNPTLIVNVVAK